MSRHSVVLASLAVIAMSVCVFGAVQRNDERVQRSSVTIDASRRGTEISKYIYGQFIEHLGRCVYGGIWAEMLEDHKFYFPIKAKYNPYRATGSIPKDSPYKVVGTSPWQITDEAESVTMVTEEAFVGEHTPLIEDGSGIRQLDLGLIKDKKYVGYVYLKAKETRANVTISLVWGDNETNRDSVQLSTGDKEYSKYPFVFIAGDDTDKGKLEIKVAGGACLVGTVSLMPADNVAGMRADTLELLKELNATMYRWPGGNFVSGYDWRDGIGERDRRPPRKNPAWTGVEHNDFGFHEFIRFCRILEAEPLVTINTGFGDAYSAAAQVEYANGSSDTLMGALRAKNGDAEPFNVKYWCVGNEMWGNWQLGYMRLDHYVLKHNWVVDKMREVDPKIISIASGNAGAWSRGLLENCADHIDMIGEHFYCREKEGLAAHTVQIASEINNKVRFQERLNRNLASLKGRDVKIAMTEWNYWYGPYLYGELGTRYFFKDALGIARGLHEYYRNTDIVFLATYAQTVNVIGAIKTSKTAAQLAATGVVLKLYRNEFGTVPVETSGETAGLDVSAALTQDGKALTVAVVNYTQEDKELVMDLKGTQLSGGGMLYVISNSDPLAYNEPGKEPDVKIVEEPLTGVSKVLKAPALSINIYKLETKDQGKS
jgi:alpha-N-arabinofuranosidase